MILDHDPYATLAPRFTSLTVPGGRVERLWTGGTWTEGPAWFPAGYLLWSDIPSNRILRWDEATGAVTTFRHPSGGANGNTVDRHGRLVTCEGSTRRLTRTESDGRITVLATHAGGQRFNAPNDVVEKSDGTLWFTDPTYGGPEYEGAPEMTGCHVWRLDPATGDFRQMTHDMVMPNGLAFGLDETSLFVIDTGSTEGPRHPNHIRRFTVTPTGLTGGEIFATSTAQRLDGLRLDSDGNLWCGEADGVHCYAPDGTRIGRIALPERAANLTFGGRDGGWLLITATTSLYRVRVGAKAA
ncbi:MAG: SMP-30/gluconolactonase/LRE family protein [Paracoccaceae bacterium]